MVNLFPVTGKESLFFGVSDGYTYKINTTLFSDDDSPIAIKICTRYDTGDGKRSTIKTFQRITSFGGFPHGTKILYSMKNENGATDYKTLKMVKQDTESFDIFEKGTAISFGLDEVSNHKVEWEGYDLEFVVEKEQI